MNFGHIAWDEIEPISGGKLGPHDAPCPLCGPHRPTLQRQRRKVLRVWQVEPDFASYSCVRCGARGWARPTGEAYPRERGSRPRNPALEQERIARQAEEAAEQRRRSAFAEFMFLSAGSIKGTLAEAYLATRGGLTAGRDQRFTPYAPFGYADATRTGPGLVSAVRDASGAVVGAHVVFLNPDGSKNTRRCFGRSAGCAIRLSEHDSILAVSEGWENARAFEALHGIPTWSAISAPGISGFEPPAGLKRLYIAADNDPEGHGLMAAKALAKRASAACEVIVSLPSAADWNDQLKGGQ